MPSEVKLSIRQETFIWLILQGQPQGKAYVAAGYKAANENVADVNASKLISSHKIATRLNELRAIVQIRHLVTVDSLTDMLFEHRKEARAAGKYAAANGALQLIA